MTEEVWEFVHLEKWLLYILLLMVLNWLVNTGASGDRNAIHLLYCNQISISATFLLPINSEMSK